MGKIIVNREKLEEAIDICDKISNLSSECYLSLPDCPAPYIDGELRIEYDKMDDSTYDLIEVIDNNLENTPKLARFSLQMYDKAEEASMDVLEQMINDLFENVDTHRSRIKIDDNVLSICDASGNILYCLTSGGRVQEYEYDENGNRIKTTQTDPDGTITEWEYEYDENGNKIKTTRTDPDGTIYEWEYDENGNLVKETKTNPDGTTSEVGGEIPSSPPDEDPKDVPEEPTSSPPPPNEGDDSPKDTKKGETPSTPSDEKPKDKPNNPGIIVKPKENNPPSEGGTGGVSGSPVGGGISNNPPTVSQEPRDGGIPSNQGGNTRQNPIGGGISNNPPTENRTPSFPGVTPYQ